MAILYVVATPIGNLEDVTLRALRILKEVDCILCEDTRVTKKLLNHYNIVTPLISYHQHSGERVQQHVYDLLYKGKNLALVTDAGTPGISDPGNELIDFLLKQNIEDFRIESIPGPSAVTAISSISGFPMSSFVFMGYPPQKNKRNKYFEKAVQSDIPVVFYESTHRIIKSLEQFREIAARHGSLGTDYSLVVGRELTKKFETIYRGTADEVLQQLKLGTTKGEFAIVLFKIKNQNPKNKPNFKL